MNNKKLAGSKVRGASMVEYTLLCIAVAVASGVAVKAVGKEVSKGATETVATMKIGGT